MFRPAASLSRATQTQATVPALCLRPRIRLWFTDISHAGGRAGALGMKVAGLVSGIATAVSMSVVAGPRGPSGFEVATLASTPVQRGAPRTMIPILAASPRYSSRFATRAGSAANGKAVAASGKGELTSTGFTGGLQAGYHWQAGTIVFGGEGDFGAFDLSERQTRAGISCYVPRQRLFLEPTLFDGLARDAAR